jgi:hypothetical protein
VEIMLTHYSADSCRRSVGRTRLRLSLSLPERPELRRKERNLLVNGLQVFRHQIGVTARHFQARMAQNRPE